MQAFGIGGFGRRNTMNRRNRIRSTTHSTGELPGNLVILSQIPCLHGSDLIRASLCSVSPCLRGESGLIL